ncbi:MAG: uroporphyrin-III C-methyltransferase / precorrin-2 dehydrogenase / sirohydrochlorin ferrochelatase [Xanthobacteraceae bacterium]|nr:MAG: uroporphyrin-III C-methyltransferase / precorrin-2 dehydrogenase / sirohydrochlorin ferrochelatase [Xanthobacteraceae bacterium]
MVALAASPPDGSITLVRRAWEPTDLSHAVFAVGAMDDDVEAATFRDAARSAGVPVNVIDKPAFCDVQFGGIVNRSPLVIGISTDGASPVFGQAVRARIEAVLPRGLAVWAAAARSWRRRVSALDLPFRARRRFWELFADRALASPDKLPSPALAAALETAATDMAPASGRLTLVGAGPGDPELLTMKAVRALQSADVIVHDDLVPSAVLDVARRESQRISAGKRGRAPSCQQDEINALVVRLVREGKHVVRLKAGDPMIFGRAGEEIAAAEAEGLALEVVPGISAAQGAAASARLSLTHRDHARRLQYVTGHGRDGRLPVDLCWTALADPTASTVVYMPGATWHEMAERLLAEGLAADTPVLAAGTVGSLASRLATRRWSGPLLILYGNAFGVRADAGGSEAPAMAEGGRKLQPVP